jgi:MEDS: MEthanogen/methylotroph, DcmR Sensory domain
MTPSGPSFYGVRRRVVPAPPFSFDRHPFDHAAFFYLEEEFLLHILCGFVVSSLQSGGGAVIMGTDDHRRSLARRLAECGVDLRALRMRKRYAEIDVDEVLAGCMEGSTLNLNKLGSLLGGAIAAARREPNSKTAPLFVFGEIVALLWARRDFENLYALEQLGDKLGDAVSTVCGYPIREFVEPGTEEAYLQICAAHSTVIPPDAYPTDEAERRILDATVRSYARAAARQDSA